MKILMLSIFAPHFFNWTEQLKDSGHEVFWLDIFDSDTKVPQIDFVHQITGWRYRLHYPGRYYLKKKAPTVTRLINTFNEINLQDFLEKKLREINPDVVHSFVMQSACLPIEKVMTKHLEIKWIYSSWGSDLYYYQNDIRIKSVLQQIDFLFTDCERDFQIAKSLGFRGEFLGVFPGRGGFNFKNTDPFMRPVSQRNVILVKGYQGKHGRSVQVLKSFKMLKNELRDYEIIVFGANKEVISYANDEGLTEILNLRLLENIPHREVIKMMGRAIIYLGNSLSDGIPNTLLEAIIMGAFPIQSNPGGATGELIIHGRNGLLIENPEDHEKIKQLILDALRNKPKIVAGIQYNLEKIKPSLERNIIRQLVLEKYASIQNHL